MLVEKHIDIKYIFILFLLFPPRFVCTYIEKNNFCMVNGWKYYGLIYHNLVVISYNIKRVLRTIDHFQTN